MKTGLQSTDAVYQRDLVTDKDVEICALLSHELRSPLHTIRNSLAAIMAEAPALDAETLRFLELIDHNTDRLILLTEKFLDLYRVRRKVVGMADEPVTIDMLLYKVLRSLDDSSRAIYRNVHIEGLQTVDMEDTWDRSRYQTGLSLTLPDGGRLLEHAIRNLLANALQYGINRQHIDCACICLRHALADENRCLLIQVSDHGAGISLEHQKKIFQPFFRVPGIPRSRPASVGLGLALVESIADYYGGSVEVQSQPGQGSTFCLKIPVEIHR